MRQIKFSIIILAYNSKTDLERLLPSIFGSESINFVLPEYTSISTQEAKNYVGEVIVVDNGSKDDTVDWLRASNYRLSVIENQNTGFASGNNIGIRQAKGEYILILNPDTRLEKDAIKIMVEFLEKRQDVGIVTCKVLLPSGKLDLACRRKFPNPWNSFLRLFSLSNRNYNMTDSDENTSQEIDSCMGAFMMCRREALEQVKIQKPKFKNQYEYFDEDFFMYGEDIDLCWRVKEAGYKVWYFPKRSITHFKGSSSKKTPFKALKWFHDAMWIFYKKHYFSQYPVVFSYAVYAAIYTRLGVLCLVNFFKKGKYVSPQDT